MDLGAEPPLDAVLVDELQAAGAVAGLEERVGGRVLAHLADPAQVALLLVRLLQQQPEGGDTHCCYCQWWWGLLPKTLMLRG